MSGFSAIRHMDVALVAQCAQQGKYDDDRIVAVVRDRPFMFGLPALALAIRWANSSTGDFDGVLNALVARRGVGILSAPLTFKRENRRVTMTPLMLVVSRYLTFFSDPFETAAEAGRTLRALLAAGADATAPAVWLENGEPVHPPHSLPAAVMARCSPEELQYMLLPLLQHGARRLPALDPPNVWRGAHEPHHPWTGLALIEFLCAFADRPELVQYVRECGENLLEYFVEVSPSWNRANPSVAHTRIRTLCDTYGFEITDALLSRAAAAEAEAADIATNSTSYNDHQAARTTTIMRQALEAERGDRRVEAIQIQRALVSRRGLPPELVHTILRASGGARPASGAAEWNAAHPTPRPGDADDAARAAASVAAWRAAHVFAAGGAIANEAGSAAEHARVLG